MENFDVFVLHMAFWSKSSPACSLIVDVVLDLMYIFSCTLAAKGCNFMKSLYSYEAC